MRLAMRKDQGAAGEGMFMLPNVDLAPGALFTMRVRSDGTWATAYPSDPNPTYCWNCTSGYTNLTNYSLSGGTTAIWMTLAIESSCCVPMAAADLDRTIDDFIIDAMCHGSGQSATSICDGSGSREEPRAQTTFTDGASVSRAGFR